MTDETREAFETSPNTRLRPVVGSRAMHRLLIGGGDDYPWIILQPDRYRYLAAEGPALLRLVIAEYLAAEIARD
jgi:hypothetical protein